jgi:hypothetical protein
MIPYPKNEGPNRLRPQPLTRPRVKCLVLSHIPGASVVFPCPPFLLPSALLFVLSLLLPLQMKGPTLGPILRLAPSLLESFQLCPATSWRGVMPLQQTVGSLFTIPLWLGRDQQVPLRICCCINLMHLHVHCLNDRSEVTQLFLCYGLCLKEGIQFIVHLLDLVELLLLLHRIHCGHNFFIQHLDLCAHLLQDLVSSSDDAHPITDFPENLCAFHCVLV